MIKVCINSNDLEFRKLFSEVCDGDSHKYTSSESTAYLLNLFKNRRQILIAFEEEGTFIGRLLLSQKDDESGMFFFGMLEYKTTRKDVAFALYEEARRQAEKLGAKKLIGPVDFSTWFSNRLKTAGFDQQYSWEPNNPECYVKDAKDFGFIIDKKYDSRFFPAMELQGKRSKIGYDLAISSGHTFRKPDLSSEMDIKRLYELNTSSFKDNYLYSPISLEEYINTHILFLKGKDLTYSTFIVDCDGVPQGYIYCFLEGDCLIFKSILINKSHQGALLSSALVHWACSLALENGIKNGAGVLIREGNVSGKFYEKIGEPYAVHKYELLKLEL